MTFTAPVFAAFFDVLNASGACSRLNRWVHNCLTSITLPLTRRIARGHLDRIRKSIPRGRYLASETHILQYRYWNRKSISCVLSLMKGISI